MRLIGFELGMRLIGLGMRLIGLELGMRLIGLAEIRFRSNVHAGKYIRSDGKFSTYAAGQVGSSNLICSHFYFHTGSTQRLI